MEVIRIALDDLTLRQQEIDTLINNSEVDTHIIELVQEQTKMLVDTTRLFNRMY
jgi:hypothetical protein